MTYHEKKVGYLTNGSFSTIQINKGPLVLNAQQGYKWYYRLREQTGRPVEQNGNASAEYNVIQSFGGEIVLPAGIFTVPGFLDNRLDDAVVYGYYAAASTIGRECTTMKVVCLMHPATR